MRTAAWQKRAWILSLVALVLMFWVVETTESFQRCVNQQQQAAPYDTLYESVAHFGLPVGGWKRCAGVFIEENGEAITAFFTVVLAVSTIGLWVKTDQLAQGAERSSQQQLRAYVSVRPIRIRNFVVGKTPEIEFLIMNSGQSPAYRARHCSTAQMAPYPLPHITVPVTFNDAETFVIHPGYEYRVMGTAKGIRPLSYDEYTAAISRDSGARLYLIGEIKYDDAFGRGWFTEFCAGLDPECLEKISGPEWSEAVGQLTGSNNEAT